MLNQYTAWIFDMDGTLTRAIHNFDAIRAELGLPEGQGILEALHHVPEPQQSQKRKRLNAIEKELTSQTSIAPGVAEFIKKLKNLGHRLGILTRNSHANAVLTLNNIGLSDFFHHQDIIARDEAAPKPSPEGIQLLLKRWAVTHHEAVMVGDFRDDFIAGRKAGVQTIYVDYEDQHLWNEHCHRRVGNLMELV